MKLLHDPESLVIFTSPPSAKLRGSRLHSNFTLITLFRQNEIIQSFCFCSYKLIREIN